MGFILVYMFVCLPACLSVFHGDQKRMLDSLKPQSGCECPDVGAGN